MMTTKRRMNVSGQFKIQQMAFMLMAVIVFFVLAGLFYLMLKSTGLNKGFTELQQEKSEALALSIAETPEMSCGGVVDGGKQGCIDTDRLITIKNSKAYQELLPVSSIIIRKVYPEIRETKECESNNYPECNQYTIKENNKGYDSGEATSYVNLCRRVIDDQYVKNKCELGVIIIKI